MGRVGCWRPEGWPGLEVAWTLRRAFWGKGYATEAAKAAFDVVAKESKMSVANVQQHYYRFKRKADTSARKAGRSTASREASARVAAPR